MGEEETEVVYISDSDEVVAMDTHVHRHQSGYSATPPPLPPPRITHSQLPQWRKEE